MKFAITIVCLALALAVYAEDDGSYHPEKYGGDDGSYKVSKDAKIIQRTAKNLNNFAKTFASGLQPPKLASNVYYPNIASAASNLSPQINKNNGFNGKLIASNPEAQSRILDQDSEILPESYHYNYETENNIKAEEVGRLLNVNTDQEALKATGFYEYVGPDNVKYRVDYIADENGFQPIGRHLPTPPPIPEAIARLLTSIPQ